MCLDGNERNGCVSGEGRFGLIPVSMRHSQVMILVFFPVAVEHRNYLQVNETGP